MKGLEMRTSGKADIEKRLREARIPEQYCRACLDTLDDTKAEEVFTVCREFAAKLEYDEKRALVLLGPPGAGKTCLACAILREVIINSRLCGRYWNAPEGLAAIRASFNSQSDEESILEVLKNGMIVIDDLGKHRNTGWAAEQLFTLIDGIYSKRRRCIITSNLSEEEFMATFDRAVLGRIVEMSHIIDVAGYDWRLDSAA
jgi:DNA replication protein DnaC